MLYIYGHVDYTDIYGSRWQRNFCYAWEPWSAHNNGFTAYQQHNNEIEIQPHSTSPAP